MRCSRCSSALVTPAQFDFGLCETCIKGAEFEPVDLSDEAFLDGLLEFARPSLDRETFRDAALKVESILLRIQERQPVDAVAMEINPS